MRPFSSLSAIALVAIIFLTSTPGTAQITITTDRYLGYASVAHPFSCQLTASYGVILVTVPKWRVAAGSALPPGLVLDSLSGKIEGTPTKAGTSTNYEFDFLITLEANGLSTSKMFTLSVNPDWDIYITSTSPLPLGAVGSYYSYQFQWTSGGMVWGGTWSMTSGSLPPGLALAGAQLAGYPTSPGTYTFTLTVTSRNYPSKEFSLTIAPALAISTGPIPTGTVSGAYSVALATTGGTGARLWSIAEGSPAPGIVLSSSGILSGVPTTPGTFNFTVQVQDSIGLTTLRALSLAVNPSPSITTRSLPAATVNVAYSTALQADGGTAPLTWTITGGSLPKGFSLTSAGTISGKSSEVSSTKVKITATDVNGVASSTNYEFIVGAATSTGTEEGIPADYALGQNYPNPFNPTSEIRFGLPAASHVRIALYNTLGQLMSVLLDEQREAGTHAVTMDAARLPSGLYYYAMEAGGKRFVRKALVVK